MELKKMFAGKKGAAYMPYVCCGDPTASFTLELVKTLVENGADAIEFGIPFSDPIADGKTIQAASGRALASGMTPKKAIGIIAKIRREGIDAPIIVMTYYNIVFAMGIDKFLSAIKKAGANALIVPDVPLEESDELYVACRKAGIDLIYLITPNCENERIRKIAKRAKGFLYAVSVLGTTGARTAINKDAVKLIQRAKKIAKMPVAVGFGISTPTHAAKFAASGADGVIVGSGIVNIYSKFIRGRKIDVAHACREIAKHTQGMKKGCRKKS